MDNKLIALVFTCIVDVTFPPYNAWAGSAQGLTVTPTANDTNAPITVHTASGALASVKRLDPALDALLTKDVVIEKLAEGFDWSEGPVWMPGGYLLFSDVPQNTIFKSNARSGVSIFLQPSGCTGTEPRGGGPGSNGLTHDKQGRLIACQQGDRRVAGWENGKFVSVADRFEGKRFNSPNDVVVKSNGDIYFTDPPRSAGERERLSQEIPFQGVYRVSAKDGSVTLLTSKVTRRTDSPSRPTKNSLRRQFRSLESNLDGVSRKCRRHPGYGPRVPRPYRFAGRGCARWTEGRSAWQSVGDRPRRRADHFPKKANISARWQLARPSRIAPGARTAPCFSSPLTSISAACARR